MLSAKDNEMSDNEEMFCAKQRISLKRNLCEQYRKLLLAVPESTQGKNAHLKHNQWPTEKENAGENYQEF